MSALPTAYILDSIRKLRGKARVTFPGESDDVLKVERIFTESKASTWRTKYPYGSADPEFPTTTLTVREQAGEDVQYIELYLAYETLPGPWLPFTRYDDDLGPVQGRRRAVANTGQEATLTATAKTTYEAREFSSIVSWEIEETYSDGTGGSVNPAYPIGVTDSYDNARGPVQITTQLVVATGSEVGKIESSGGIVTTTEFTPFNQFLLKKSVEVSAIPGPTRPGQQYDKTLGVAFPFTRKIVATGTATVGADINPINEAIAEEELIDISAAQAILDGIHITYPSQESIRLPDELKSVDLYWDAAGTESTSVYSSGGGAALDAIIAANKAFNFTYNLSCNAVVGGDFVVNIKEGFVGSVPSEVHTFYLPFEGVSPVTPTAIMTAVNAIAWPIHRAESQTVVLFGESLSVGMSSQVVGVVTAGTGSATIVVTRITTNRAAKKTIKTLHIPPTIHPVITINEIGDSTAEGSATDTEGNSVTAPVAGRLSNSQIAATNLTAFPTGRYILNSTVRPYAYGRALVTVILVEVTSNYTS